MDYDETFCPEVRQESLRILIALSVQQDLKLQQVDVTTAFLKGSLEEEVFMRQPEGFEVKGKENLVCKLKKSIYGLKQSPRSWNAALDSQLREIDRKMTRVFTSRTQERRFCTLECMFILAGKTDGALSEVKTALSRKFDIKDLGNLS